jgi:Asp-tRNA(Asn)/Glu-tRNA(Gln) amidotransferase A subunit family amidase
LRSIYDPSTAKYLCFADARADFLTGRDNPSAYLERCLARIELLEPKVQAFAAMDAESARAAAKASAERYRSGRPLSLVDGLPIGIKDCYETAGFPMEVNSPLFAGYRPDRDAAHVYALRQGGAIIVGKTVTTELTMAGPGPTLNPWDLTRTPGGSSSGSAATVAASMLPAATGSQVRGSVLRPASICGVIGYKPTYGAVNRLGGFDPNPTLNHFGILAGTLVDAWEITRYIAQTVGGDPGHLALRGDPTLPRARKPLQIARQYTHGWSLTDSASKQAFDNFISTVDVEIVEPSASPELQAYEEATRRTPEFFFDLMLWEMAWPMLEYRKRRPEALSATIQGYLDRLQAMTATQYELALERRAALRAMHRALRGRVDGFITLAHIGPGQKGLPIVGTPWYNDPSSAIGAPTVSLPLLSVEAVPLGIQLMGFEQEDEALMATARWFLEHPRSRPNA